MKDLADRVVALGVGDKNEADQYYAHFGINREWLTAEQFCTDGRVVLAMMEKVSNLRFSSHDDGWVAFAGKIRNSQVYESLAPAILTACAEALEQQESK